MENSQTNTMTTKKILLNLNLEHLNILDDVKHWRNVSRNKLLQTIISEWLITNQSSILKQADARDRERNNIFNPSHSNVDTSALDDVTAQ